MINTLTSLSMFVDLASSSCLILCASCIWACIFCSLVFCLKHETYKQFKTTQVKIKSGQLNSELKLLQLIEEIQYCDNFNSQNMIPNSFFRPQPAMYLVSKLENNVH